MSATRLKIAKDDILSFFNKLPEKIFRRIDIAKHLSAERDFWRLTERTTTNEFIKFLIKTGNLETYHFPFPKPYKAQTRYTWGKKNVYEVLLALSSGSYFCHYTAMRMHGLTEQIPKTLYLNHEQVHASISTGTLSQGSLDSAFKRPARISSEVAEMESYRVCIIHGGRSDGLGIIEQHASYDSINRDTKVRITDVERTLIDIAVRPAYSGGVQEVLKAYQIAHESISLNRLAATLQQLNYIYPYHQAIGFYLERAGVKPSSLDLFRKVPIQFDFYLTHQMKDTEYVKDWRLHIPKGL